MPDSEDQEKQTDVVEFARGFLLRRRWWIILTAGVVTVATVAGSYLLPNRYESDATILLLQQRVPERYVTPTSTTDLKTVDAMTAVVLSRTQLLAIVNDLDLYPKERNRLAPEELVELMRHDVTLTPVQSQPDKKELDSLKISFTGPDPRVAQEVTSRLTTLFIQQNLKTREEQATTTTAFLRRELESTRAKLADEEQRVRDFKMQYLGELPEQQQGNLGILSSVQSQLQNVSSNLSRALQQKLYLESLISQYQHLPPGAAGPSLSGSPAVSTTALTPLEKAQQDLTELQADKEHLLAIYTPQHPDVVRKSQQIVAAQALVERLRSEQDARVLQTKSSTPKSDVGHHTDPQRRTEESAVIAQLNSQLEANRLEIEDLSKTEQQLKGSLAAYQNRLNQTPVREQQLTSILRDYDLLKQHYADLLNKEQQSQLATTLEKQQEGQQFRMIDPPSLPAVPSSPKRMKIALGGLAGGLFLGLALAFLMEKSDSSFHAENSLKQRFELPLVIAVPFILTNPERRVRKYRGALEWIGGCVVLVMILAAEFYALRHR